MLALSSLSVTRSSYVYIHTHTVFFFIQRKNKTKKVCFACLQVVKNITKLSEESKHSQADNTEKSQSTEVDIKVRHGSVYVSFECLRGVVTM